MRTRVFLRGNRPRGFTKRRQTCFVFFLPPIQRRLSDAYSATEMELGHILWPSDPGIQRPGDPVDPVTLFYNELQSRLMCRGVRIEFFFCSSNLSSILSSTRVLDKVSKYVRVFISAFQMYVLHFGHFLRKPEKLGSHTGSKWWHGDPDVKDDPNDPLTRWPNDPVPCLTDRRTDRHTPTAGTQTTEHRQQ